MLLEQVVQLFADGLSPGVFEHQVDHSLAPVWRRQVDRLTLIRRFERPVGGHRGNHHQILGELHHVLVVGVSLVTLEQRELGIVAGRKALIAKDTADFVNAFKPADEQPLEMQLECDAEKQVAIQRVVVGLKRTRMAAAGNFLQHRRLHVDEPTLVQQTSHRRDDLAARAKHLAHLRVGDQVDVSLPVANLDVLQAVPLLGHWSQRLRQQLERVHLERDLTALRPKDGAGHSDDVAHIEIRKP